MTASAPSIRSPAAFAALGALLIVWYAGLSYLPSLLGTCFDGVCGSPLELLASVAVPGAFFLLPVALDRAVFGGGLRAMGVTRIGRRGLGAAALYVAPLLLFFPALALATWTPLALRPGWPWIVLGVVLNNGLAEETMMRGFVYRHLREGRTFWRAATLSTLFFAGYHVPLLWSAGSVVGGAAVVLAVPSGYVTAWLYEEGEETIGGPALMHVVHNALVMVFVAPFPTAPALYMALGTAIALAAVARYARRLSRAS